VIGQTTNLHIWPDYRLDQWLVIQQKGAVGEAGFGLGWKEDVEVAVADNPCLCLGIMKEKTTWKIASAGVSIRAYCILLI
jgi:hypothetical protein